MSFQFTTAFNFNILSLTYKMLIFIRVVGVVGLRVMNILVYFENLSVIRVEATWSSLRFHCSLWNIISAWSPNPFASVTPKYIFIPYNNEIY